MWSAQCTVINSALYITGGWCPNDYRKNNNVYKYDFDNNQWIVLPPLEQYYGIPVSVNDQLTIISGRSSTFPFKITKWVVTFSDNRWKNIYPNLSVARVQPAVVTYHQYIIVAGGQGDDQVLDSIEVFEISTFHWIIINTRLPLPMWRISATLSADSFIIVGYSGANSSYKETFMIAINDMISKPQQSLTSSANDNKWHQLTDTPYRRTTVVPNTSPPVILGGEDKQGNTVNNIAIYDDRQNEWNKISTIPIKCAYTTVAIINQSIIVMGGCSDVKTDETRNATALSDVNIGHLKSCD